MGFGENKRMSITRSIWNRTFLWTFGLPKVYNFKISGFQVLTLDMGPAKVRDQSDAFSGFSYFQVPTIERRCTAPLRLVHCVYRREIDIVQTCTNKWSIKTDFISFIDIFNTKQQKIWLPGRVVPHSPWQLLAARAGVPLSPTGTPRAAKGVSNGTTRARTTCPDSEPVSPESWT